MISLKDPSLFTQQAYVGGEWVDAPDGKTEQVTNPATGEVLGTVPVLGREINVAEPEDLEETHRQETICHSDEMV